MKYEVVYECCLNKVEELGIEFDFDNNSHIQSPQNMDDIYKNFVYHSQNRSQGYAINFFKEEIEGDRNFAVQVWKCIKNLHGSDIYIKLKIKIDENGKLLIMSYHFDNMQ